MAERTQALLAMYEEHAQQARMHEDQREKVTNIILVIVAALVGLIGTLKFSLYALPAALTTAYLGYFGRKVSLKHYERNRLHVKVLCAFREELDNELKSAGSQGRSLSKINWDARQEHKEKFAGELSDLPERARQQVAERILGIRLFRLWARLPLLAEVLGWVFVLLILIHNWDKIWGWWH